MAKTATLNVRIEPEVKEAAVKIFDEWGISTSSAINMMLKNIVRSKDAHPDMLFPRRDGLLATWSRSIASSGTGGLYAALLKYIICDIIATVTEVRHFIKGE